MTANLRELARRALHERRPEVSPEADVERVVIDVRMGERVEMVTLSVRDERLVVLATDGTAATSPAARAALAWLASELPRTSLPPERRDRAPAADRPAEADPLALAIADLTTAIVRQGIDAAQAPATIDALARIGATSPSLEVARWVGRLRAALAARDEILAARLLDGAGAVLTPGEPERIVDQVLVELGREVVDGLTPLAMERRHLLDPTTGEVLAEERLRDQPASNGPCPRVVNVGLASRTRGGRVRVVQYSVARLDPDMLARLEALAEPSVAAAFARAEAGIRSALLEPAVLLRLGSAEGGTAVDATGAPIPLARHEDAGAVSAFVDELARGAPSWIFGRWTVAGDEASLLPLSCCVSGRVTRLR